MIDGRHYQRYMIYNIESCCILNDDDDGNLYWNAGTA